MGAHPGPDRLGGQPVGERTVTTVPAYLCGQVGWDTAGQQAARRGHAAPALRADTLHAPAPTRFALGLLIEADVIAALAPGAAAAPEG